MRKKHPLSIKIKVALEAIKEQKTVTQISSIYQVHPDSIRNWKKTVINNLEILFKEKHSKKDNSQEELIAELYKIIGQRDVELSWLKKKLSIPDT